MVSALKVLSPAALRAADAGASADAFSQDLAASFPRRADDDVILLREAAPVVAGRAEVTRLLAAQPPVRVSWQPYRVLVSRDAQLGVTFGETLRYGSPDAPAGAARYITVWRRLADGGWKIAAHAQIGLVPPDSVRVPPDTRRASFAGSDVTNAFARADIDFAAAAKRSGAPDAFFRFAAMRMDTSAFPTLARNKS